MSARDDGEFADLRLLIDGKLVAGAATMEVVNPATGASICACPRASKDQLEQAISAAKVAFRDWARTPIRQRGKILESIADRLNVNQAQLARLLTMEQGKPLADATVEVATAEAMFRYFGSLELPVTEIETNDKHIVEGHRYPLGVIAAIIPWNFPLLTLASKIAPALMAGNTVVAKPAPTTPLATLLMGALIADLLPAGTLNIITDANDLGDAITAHPDIAKVSFTGSTATGKKVMASAGDSLKRLTLELGGNDPAIVLDDVDPKAIAPSVFGAAFINNGQVCLAIKRLYVHESVYDRMVEELAGLARQSIVGDGLEQGTQLGPVQNRMQFEKMKGFLEDASRNGEVVTGGDVVDGPGYFVQPTIVKNIAEGARLVDEEQFGPILPVIRFDDVDDVVERANATNYGLGASVWGSNVERAREVAMQLEAGTVWINQHLDFGINIPFGGAKQSGFGVELGEEGLREFTQLRVLNQAV
jgi:acyl-CoA reductase-like NAD-dependent aldehyde dehydrogenase